MHYGTKVYSDLLSPDSFLSEFEDTQIQRQKGNTLKLENPGKIGAMKVGVIGFEPATGQ
jgi:hypothetical protein